MIEQEEWNPVNETEEQIEQPKRHKLNGRPKGVTTKLVRHKNELDAELTKELRIREKARKSFLHFIQYLNPDYVVKPFHKIIIEQCEKWIHTPGSKLIICLPVRSGKSEIVSRYLPAFIFGLNSNAQIMACSYGASLASAMNKDVQRIIESEAYSILFPNVKLPSAGRGEKGGKRTEREFEIIGAKGYYSCAGTGAGIAGKGWLYGIIDDPFGTAESANSILEQDKVWQWYLQDFKTRATPPTEGRILVMATRWNVNDLIGKILQQDNKDEWIVIRFPLICEDERSADNPFEYRKKGECLWSERYGDAKSDRVKELQQDAYTFSALYQQNPKIRGGNVLKEEWIAQVYSLPDRFTQITLYWDIGGSDNPKSDSTVGTIVGREADGSAVVIFQDGFRLNPDSRNKRMLTVCQQFKKIFPAMQVFVEAGVGLGVEGVNNIRNFLLSNAIPIRLDNVRKSKYERATDQTDSFLASAEGGRIRFYLGFNENNWVWEFFNETNALQFAQGAKGIEFVGGHDDRLDSLVGAYSKSFKKPFQVQWAHEVGASVQKDQPLQKQVPLHLDTTFR